MWSEGLSVHWAAALMCRLQAPPQSDLNQDGGDGSSVHCEERPALELLRYRPPVCFQRHIYVPKLPACTHLSNHRSTEGWERGLAFPGLPPHSPSTNRLDLLCPTEPSRHPGDTANKRRNRDSERLSHWPELTQPARSRVRTGPTLCGPSAASPKFHTGPWGPWLPMLTAALLRP